MASTLGTRPDYDPRTKLAVQDNEIYLTGTQALVRVVLDQLRRDAAAEIDTAAFVSGYPGSPLGAFDLELSRQARLLRELRITHLPGHNEEIAATSVYGSQMAQTFPDARHDGVLGVWYGKGPGLDRAADAIRHAQYVGTARNGGVLAFVGDDPACKSSSIPNSTEHTLQDLGLPILTPCSVADVLELGPHGVALSRLSGLWTGVRVVTDVADGAATVSGRLSDPAIQVPEVTWDGRRFEQSLRGIPGPPWSIEIEAELRGPRMEMARSYGYLNQLNRIVVAPHNARVSLVAVGHLYPELRSALTALGLDDASLMAQGIRVCQVRMQHPLDPRTLREFAEGAERMIVIEEKRPVVERLLREVLYRSGHQPLVLGKEDADGRALFPMHGAIHRDEILQPLYRQLSEFVDTSGLRGPDRTRRHLPIVNAGRAPYFCSGCPHNSSTRVPDGAVVGGGIGCHGMTQFMDSKVVGDVATTTHMGSEGAQWLGISPHVETDHMFQNLGDGTYFHSGQLAVQAAVAAKAHLTYKLLYNDAIAMTGGQSPAESNALAVPDVAAILIRQGVARIIITTDDTRSYRRTRLPANTEVWDRGRIVAAQEALRSTPGVTVLIHDQRCAAENRRDRKRGKLPAPEKKVVINERICEGCGDCGAKSNCLSVEPIDTEFGRKTQINQTTCNSDYSCLAGDCPSFVTIAPPKRKRRGGPHVAGPARPRSEALDRLLQNPPAEPQQTSADDHFCVRMPGIGGTGVVTASQILGTAAMLDGKVVHGMDQTGLSQKAGPVISDLVISSADAELAARAGAASVDLLLGFDVLVAGAATTQESLRPGHTTAVVSATRTPTGAMVSDVAVAFPDIGAFQQDLEELLGAERVHWADATEITSRLFGDSSGANIFLVGMAYQTGVLPLSAASVEAAIGLNGVAVARNIAAFRAGRWWIEDQARLGNLFDDRDHNAPTEKYFGANELPPQPRADAERRAGDLVGYQDRRYAQDYVDLVRRVAQAETRVTGTPGPLTGAVLRNLHKLMAYKDEYEVARLTADPAERARIDAVYGPGARVYWNLHPPVLRDLGLAKRKLVLGRWFTPAFAVLRRMRRLRGTAFDPFGRTEVRRLERQLVAEYRNAVEHTIRLLDAATIDVATELAELPDAVRGYEQLKLRSGRAFLDRLAECRAAVDRASTGKKES